MQELPTSTSGSCASSGKSMPYRPHRYHHQRGYQHHQRRVDRPVGPGKLAAGACASIRLPTTAIAAPAEKVAAPANPVGRVHVYARRGSCAGDLLVATYRPIQSRVMGPNRRAQERERAAARAKAEAEARRAEAERKAVANAQKIVAIWNATNPGPRPGRGRNAINKRRLATASGTPSVGRHCGSRCVYIGWFYRAPAAVIRDASCFGPSTTTSAPIFTRL